MCAAASCGLEGEAEDNKGCCREEAEASQCPASAGDLQREARPGGPVSGPSCRLESSVGQGQQGSLLCQPKNKGGHALLSSQQDATPQCCLRPERLYNSHGGATIARHVPSLGPTRGDNRRCRGWRTCANGTLHTGERTLEKGREPLCSLLFDT